MALLPEHRALQFQVLAWTMLSRAAAAMFHLMHSRHSGYPYKLWTLLGPDRDLAARQILRDPDCLHDSWSSAFIKRWGDRSAAGLR